MWRQPVQKPWLKNEQQQQRQSWNNPGQQFQQQQQITPQFNQQSENSGWQGGIGKGGGDGGGGGWGGSGQKETALPDGVRVDKDARYLGKVIKYVKWSGYGWIEFNDKDVIPENKIFVFHKSLKSEDRFPFLVQDMEVELSLHPYRKKSMPGKIFVRAKNVSMPGGAAIAIQDQVDADKKTFVGGQHLRYSGLLEWYSIQRGFGYVKMDDGFDMGGEIVPKSLKVEQAEVNAGGKEIPSKMKEIQVEFSIWKTLKGEYRVYNMTLPGMMPITASALENRKVVPGQEFKGTVQQNWWQQGYGQIQVAEGAVLPEPVKAKMKGDLLYFRNADIKEGQWLKKGMEVTFQVYTDDKGCGACEIAGPERDAMET